MAVFVFHQGSRYIATMSLGLLERFSSSRKIAGILRDAGFSEVRIFQNGTSHYAEVFWRGTDATVEMPPQITAVTKVQRG